MSRYLLRCQAVAQTDGEHVRPVFDAAFCEFGLPLAIRSDYGPPFASVGAGGLSRLAVWWIKLGVRPERIEPGKPTQNGRHERMHRTLKADAADPPAATLAEQQRRFDEFRAVYNHERPHEALDFETPAALYRASDRAYPCALREPDYPDDCAVRRVRSNGVIKWAGDLIFVSEALGGGPWRSRRPRRANCGFATPTSNSDSSTKAAAFAAGNCRGRPPVDLWTTLRRCPQSHRKSSSNSRPRNGQKCQPCIRSKV